MAVDPDPVRRLVRVMADDAASHAAALGRIDPSWGTRVDRWAGGWAVWCSPGMYVNRAVGDWAGGRPGDFDLDGLERVAADVGVSPAIDLVGGRDDALARRLAARDYHRSASVSLAARALTPADRVPAPTPFTFEPVVDAAGLAAWQDAAASGWGHTTPARRRASDAFAAAAHAAEGCTLLVVHDREGRAVASCSLVVRDGVATLGAMSVVPEGRRRGVQAAAIRHRIALAQAAGCDVAATTTVVAGDSERNVAWHGFERLAVITTWEPG